MMGGRRTMFRYICQLVDLPVVGYALYRLNVNRPMIRLMGRGHVYADPAWLDEGRLAEKLAVTNAPGLGMLPSALSPVSLILCSRTNCL